MERERFEGILGRLGRGGASRRSLARGLAGLGLGALLPGFASAAPAEEAKKGRKKKAARCSRRGQTCSGEKRCCAGLACKNGRCDCAGGKTKCGARCRDLKKDKNNCGACGNKCGAGQVCANGACRCGNGQQLCGGVCRNLQTDEENCGACGRTCAAGETCSGGFCVQVVDAGGDFEAPAGIAVADDGTRFVIDSGVHALLILNERGDIVRAAGGRGAADGQFEAPRGISLANGKFFVADTGNHRVQRFNLQGDHELSFGFFGGGTEQFNAPAGIAAQAFPNDNTVLYVTDTGNHGIKRHTETGFFLSRFGRRGDELGELDLPVGVAVRREGARDLIYIAEFTNDRIQIFEREGGRDTAIGVFGSQGSGNGQFNGPRGVAIAPDGTVFVADTGNDRIQQFTAEGQFIRVIGGGGSAPGQFSKPGGVFVDADGAIHVADTGNGRIQRLKPGSLATKARPEAASARTKGAAERRGEREARDGDGRSGAKVGVTPEAQEAKPSGVSKDRSDRDAAGKGRSDTRGGSGKKDNGSE